MRVRRSTSTAIYADFSVEDIEAALIRHLDLTQGVEFDETKDQLEIKYHIAQNCLADIQLILKKSEVV